MSIIQNFIQNAQPHWQHYTQHDFVARLANGTLPKASFQHYLKQDYIYLFHYCRAFSLGIFKAENFDEMQTARESIAAILDEIQLHISFCEEWGISLDELQQTQESAACIAYTRFVLDCGVTGGLPELYAAIAPCALGYAEIGQNIVAQKISPKNNPYQKWIDTYAHEDFQQAAQQIGEFLAQQCAKLPANRLAKLQDIFTTATRMECAFWQMGLDLS